MKKIIKMFTASLAVIMTITGFCAMTPASGAVAVYVNRNQYFTECSNNGYLLAEYDFTYDNKTKIYTAKFTNVGGVAELADISIYGECRKSTTNKDGSLLTTHSTSSVKAVSSSAIIKIPTGGTNWQFVSASISSDKDFNPFWVQSYVGGFE